MPQQLSNNHIEQKELHIALAMLNEPTKRMIARILGDSQSNPATITRLIFKKEEITMNEYKNILCMHIKKMERAGIITKLPRYEGCKYQDYTITPLGILALERKGLRNNNNVIEGFR